MATEFRNSLFGFNKDDVLGYVHQKDAELKILSSELNSKIDELTNQLNTLKQEHKEALITVASLSAENDVFKAHAKEVEDRANELEVLSTKIGKLYLMSQATAKTITQNAEQNAEIASKQTEANVNNLDVTQGVLKDIISDVLSASQSFVSRLDELNGSLAEAKLQIRENNNISIKISEEFAELYSKLG